MIFTKDDQYYVLKTSQSVPEEIAKVFNFFENPSNLNLITPSWLNFTLLPPVPCTTFENQEIEYKLTLHNKGSSGQAELSITKKIFRFVTNRSKDHMHSGNISICLKKSAVRLW